MRIANEKYQRNLTHFSLWFLVKPRIDRECMKSVTIKAGRSTKWTVDVSGEPPPENSWHFKDKKLCNTERIKIENVDYQTTFNLIKAVRKDTGIYKLLAENPSGKDEATLELTVLCKSTAVIYNNFIFKT